MFRTTFTNTVTTPIPPDVNPDIVIELLHNHRFLITMSPIVTRHSPATDGQEAGGKITYDVWEDIDLLPFGWWKHEIHFTAAFTDKLNGEISWVEAPLGFSSKADYTVRAARQEDYDAGVYADSDGGGGAMVLEEAIETSCSVVFKPFVEMTMVPVRQKMHAQVVERAWEIEYGGGGGPWGNGEGPDGRSARP
ncbi:hypothetical protein LTR36_002407 [Oleoguttula mirabilis]|uniref:DUF7053 domain-containing protein n=1 Tax=Oleoguttula mirabilis TaxID=1507867 RepID=A0AAV9JLQ8_9PEZI|nr:hypothetical protein LTR36_002407 [Oleoguttula mirabilis]